MNLRCSEFILVLVPLYHLLAFITNNKIHYKNIPFKKIKCDELSGRSQFFLFQPHSLASQSGEESIAISKAGLYFVILLQAGERKPRKPKFRATVANFAFSGIHSRASS